MSYSICCENSSLQTELEGLTMIDTDYTIIMNFKKQLTQMYSSYRSKKRLFSLLRFLQITGGFMITTLTTYNNPYFKDNSDSIGIIVWYISISNNIVNLLTEKLGAYDLSGEKVKLKLMIDEGKLYNKNEKNYSFYSNGMKEDKLEYFSMMYKQIQQSTDPYIFLTRNEKNAEHNDIIMKSKTKRLSKLWRVLTPPTNKTRPIIPNEVIDEMIGMTDGQTDGLADEITDEITDGQTERTSINSNEDTSN